VVYCPTDYIANTSQVMGSFRDEPILPGLSPGY